MHHRLTGLIIAAFSLYSLYLGINALWFSAELAKNVGESASVFNQSIDPSDFLFHWRLDYGAVSCFAGLGLVASVAMFLLKRWSWPLVGGIAACCLLLSILGAVSGYSRYGFEHVGLAQLLALAVAVALAVFANRRWPRTIARNGPNA